MIERCRREWWRRRRRGGSAVGAIDNRGAKGAEGGMVWGEGVPLPRKFFSIFSLKIAIFGAFWAAIFTVQRTVLYADHVD